MTEMEEEPRLGLRIHLEYDYLTNRDISWVFGFCRNAMRESLAHALDIDTKELKWVQLPLDVYSVRTERSIEIIVTGVASAVTAMLAAKFGEDVYRVIRRLVVLAYERIKRRPPRARRRNLLERKIELIAFRKESFRRRTILEVDDTGNAIRRVVEEDFEVVDAFELR